jgi:hypothetical protein
MEKKSCKDCSSTCASYYYTGQHGDTIGWTWNYNYVTCGSCNYTSVDYGQIKCPNCGKLLFGINKKDRIIELLEEVTRLMKE